MIQSTSSAAAYCFLIYTRGSSHLCTILVDEACQLQEAVGGHCSVAWSWRMIWEGTQESIQSQLEGFGILGILYVCWHDIEDSGSCATEEVVPCSLERCCAALVVSSSTLRTQTDVVLEFKLDVIWCQAFVDFPEMDKHIPLSSPLQREQLQALKVLPVLQYSWSSSPLIFAVKLR